MSSNVRHGPKMKANLNFTYTSKKLALRANICQARFARRFVHFAHNNAKRSDMVQIVQYQLRFAHNKAKRSVMVQIVQYQLFVFINTFSLCIINIIKQIIMEEGFSSQLTAEVLTPWQLGDYWTTLRNTTIYKKLTTIQKGRVQTFRLIEKAKIALSSTLRTLCIQKNRKFGYGH